MDLLQFIKTKKVIIISAFAVLVIVCSVGGYLIHKHVNSKSETTSKSDTENVETTTNQSSPPAKNLNETVLNGDENDLKGLIGTRNIDEKNEYGETPLHVAAAKGKDNMIRLLIDNGADIEARTKNSWTPIIYTVQYYRMGTYKLLVERGANLSAQDNLGYTPLHIFLNSMVSASEGNLQNLKILLKNNAGINLKDQYGRTALHAALVASPRYQEFTRFEEIIKLLIDAGSDVNTRDDRLDTPLLHAVYLHDEPNVKLLTENGADVNVRRETFDRNTALHFAVLKGNENMVKMLIGKQAKITVVNKDGLTPLELAKKLGHQNIVAILDSKR